MSDLDGNEPHGAGGELPPTLASTGGATSLPGPDLARGSQLGRYLVLDRVGAGGMGVVYAAYDPTLDRKVAVKLLLGDARDPDRVELLREAQAMARLQHPNVAAIHDVGRFGDGVFMAMEFVEGETLGEHLRKQGQSGTSHWRDILRIFVEAGRGLAAAHAAGLVHRDSGPSQPPAARSRAMRGGARAPPSTTSRVAGSRCTPTPARRRVSAARNRRSSWTCA